MPKLLMPVLAATLLIAGCGGDGDTDALRTQVAALQTQLPPPTATSTPPATSTPRPTPTPVREYVKELRAQLAKVGEAEGEILDAQGGDLNKPFTWTAASFSIRFRTAAGHVNAAYTELASAAERIPAAVYDSYCTAGIRDWARQASRYWTLISTALANNDVDTWNTAIDMQPSMAAGKDRAVKLCPNL